jgi:hypothetical protein
MTEFISTLSSILPAPGGLQSAKSVTSGGWSKLRYGSACREGCQSCLPRNSSFQNDVVISNSRTEVNKTAPGAQSHLETRQHVDDHSPVP